MIDLKGLSYVVVRHNCGCLTEYAVFLGERTREQFKAAMGQKPCYLHRLPRPHPPDDLEPLQ